MKLEQFFYGNTGGGYKILGASDSSYANKVVEICMAIGTPDGISKVTPFLISVPDGENLVMVCCRLGAQDLVERKTLFFHAFVGSRKEANRAGINAFSLFDAGQFRETMPRGNVNAITLDSFPNLESLMKWEGGLVAIRSKQPMNNLLKGVLGGSVNDFAWSSFAFCPLSSQFKIYAISTYVLPPKYRLVYNCEERTFNGAHPCVKTERKKNQRPFLVGGLILLILLNICFVYGVLTDFPKGVLRTETEPQIIQSQIIPPQATHHQLTETQKKDLIEEGKRLALTELKNSLPEPERVRSIKDGMPSPCLEAWEGGWPDELRPGEGKTHKIYFDRLERFVLWVNEHVFAEEGLDESK